MKKIIAGLFISLDGVVEAPDQWHFPYFNEEMGAAVDASLGRSDTMLFGRKTYDSFAGAWPERESAGGEDAPFAKALATPARSSCRTRISPSPGATRSSCAAISSRPSPR